MCGFALTDHSLSVLAHGAKQQLVIPLSFSFIERSSR